MLKLMTTLVRGTIADAEEAAFDLNATRVLAQQIRDAATALELSKKELACAMAHRDSEARAVATLETRINELEQSAIEAINGHRPELADEAATVIAAVENERADRQAAVEGFNADIARLEDLIQQGQQRLRDLSRGLEMARAQEALNRAGANGRRALATGSGALREAEQTLARIRQSQTRADDTQAALDYLEEKANTTSLDARFKAAGFGPTVSARPSDVLARIQSKAHHAAQTAQNTKTAGNISPANDAEGA